MNFWKSEVGGTVKLHCQFQPFILQVQIVVDYLHCCSMTNNAILNCIWSNSQHNLYSANTKGKL